MDASGNAVNVFANSGDVILGQSEFYEPLLTVFDSVAPTVGPLVETIREHRFLMIGGLFAGKEELARFCARTLVDLLSSGDKGNPLLTVKVWHRSSNPRSIIAGIEAEKHPTAFILPDIAPHDLRYDVQRICE